MKNLLKITLGCAILTLMVVLTSHTPAKAGNIDEYTFKEDLDGNGKKEKITNRIEYNEGNYVYKIEIIINGKKAFSETLENNCNYFDAGVYVLDINSKDKYKELVIQISDEFSTEERAYRYKKKKLKLLFETDGSSYLSGLVEKQNPDKNVLMIDEVITPIGNNFYVVTNNKISKKKLKEIKPKDGLYSIVEESWGGREFVFELAKDADIYTEADGKEVKMTLEKGTKFHVYGLKRVKNVFKYGLISLVDGEENIGWMDLSQHDSYDDMLVTNPVFAG